MIKVRFYATITRKYVDLNSISNLNDFLYILEGKHSYIKPRFFRNGVRIPDVDGYHNSVDLETVGGAENIEVLKPDDRIVKMLQLILNMNNEIAKKLLNPLMYVMGVDYAKKTD